MSSGVFSQSHSVLCSRKPSQYYLAYGSNLSTEQMKERCPDAEVMGTASIPGYRLLFKKSGSGFYATIEQDANCSVPVLVYKISERDEALLNGYEGFPKHYYKKYFRLPIYKPDGKRMSEKHTCMVYILHEERLLGEPRTDYFRKRGVRAMGLRYRYSRQRIVRQYWGGAVEKVHRQLHKGSENEQ